MLLVSYVTTLDVSDNEAIGALGDLLGSDISALVGDAAELPRLEEDAPSTESYNVVVEDLVVATSAGLKDGLLLWAIAHVVYAQGVRRNGRRPFYLFLQHFVLKVNDGATLPRSCWRTAKALNL